MAVEVILPRVDMDMTTGKISRWYVKDGDTVNKGAPIFEIETDKAAMEVEAPGRRRDPQHLVGEGASVPVGAAVAFIYAEGEAVRQRPLRQRRAAQLRRLHAAVSCPALAAASRQAPRATPLARRLARQAGLAIAAIAGSGPAWPHRRGRCERGGRGEAPLPPPQAMPALQHPDDPCRRSTHPAASSVIPVDGMRRTIAERLVQSKQTVPHFYLTVTCDLAGSMAAREQLNASAPKGADGKPLWKLSVNDFIIKAMALALQKVPAANVTWAGDGDPPASHQRRWRCGGRRRRAVHAGHPQRRDEVAHRHLREMKDLAAAPARASWCPPNIRAARRRSRISACTASSSSPPSSIRRRRRSWRWAPASNASCRSMASRCLPAR